MEQKIVSNDKKLYWALILAILALLIGATGLILSFQKGNSSTLEPVTSGSPNSADQMPPGVTGQPNTVEIHPDGKQGVVESEKKK